MSTEYLDPADTVIRKLGGVQNAATAAGVSIGRVYRWRRSKSDGGTGGLIPSRHHLPILEWAKSQGIRLTAKDLVGAFTGRPSPGVPRSTLEEAPIEAA